MKESLEQLIGMTLNKIVVTGAKGYIGSNLKNFVDNSEYRERFNWKFFCKEELNILDYEKVLEALHGADLIINLACLDNKRSCSDGLLSLKVNTFGAETIYRAVIKKKIKVIQFSTSEVLNFINSTGFHSSDRLNYARHKYLSEELLLKMMSKDQYKIVRLFATYGGLNSKSVVDIFKNKASKGEMCNVINPHTTRDFVHIEDVCSFVFHILENWDKYENIINFGTGKQTSLSAILDILGQKYKFKAEEKFISELSFSEDLSNFVNHKVKMTNLKSYLLS